jgi:hypothetical protein
VLDAVDDLGFDNTGSMPIDDRFAAAYQTGTLIEFPPGEYLISHQQPGGNVSNFGVRGTGSSRRDVRIRPVKGDTLKWLKAVDAGPHLIENISLDERSDDSTQLSLWLTTGDGSVVKNVEWLGRTPDDSGVGYSLTAEVTDQNGVFTIDGVYAGLDEPATRVEYPDGVAFIHTGPPHEGELVIRNPVIHERNSSATRSTAPTGVVTIEGGEFVNNQNANIRFGAGDHPTKVSSATGTYVGVDGSRKSADAVRLDASSNGYSGAVFRHLEIEWTKELGRGVVAVPEWGGHGRAVFHDCVIHNDGARTLTVDADPTSTIDNAIIMDRCSFTGSGAGFRAVGRPGSAILNSCIDMPNASIRGFRTQHISRSGCRRPEPPESIGLDD